MRNKIVLKKIGLSVASVAACLALAAVVYIMVVPKTALAHHAGSPKISCFKVFASGDITFAQEGPAQGTLSGRGKKARDIRLYFGRTPKLVLDFFASPDGPFGEDGARCFSNSSPWFMEISPEKDGSAHVVYGFFAFGTDGSDITYYLDMYGSFDDEATFPPTETDKFNGMDLTWWELSIDAKGKYNRIACTGSGNFSTGVMIDVEFVGIMDENGQCPSPEAL